MRKSALLLLSVVLLLAFNIPASAVTLDEVVNMHDAGVSSDVIIALIQTSESAFYLTAEDVIMLEEAGVPDDVILEMVLPSAGQTDESKAYLELSDDQFRQLFLDDSEAVIPASSVQEPVREPAYYRSNPSSAPRNYVSYPDNSSYGYSSGGTGYNYDYGYSSPGYNTRSRKVYRATWYPGSYYSPYPLVSVYPGYYGNYGGGYNGYSGGGYYPTSYYGNRYYGSGGYHGNWNNNSNCYGGGNYYGYSSRHYKSGSRARIRSYDDDWYFALGISF